jgi:type III restriction enzyme
MTNAVENPILNSPFEEPSRYYDFTGAEPRTLDGRRPAGYHGTVRTEQMEGALAAHEFIALPEVNKIRERVRQWHAGHWPGVTPVTRDLLEHWHRKDRRPLFFCQREAAEAIIWLTEAAPADRQGIEVPQDEPSDIESIKKGYPPLRRYCTKMATGSGKTTVMAMVAAWSILNKIANRQDARFADSVLVVCPNLTVKERLAVLRPQEAGNYYEKFDLVPNGYRDMLARGRVFVTNWHVFAVKDDARSRGIVQRGRESDSAFVRRVLDRDLGKASSLLVLNDEAHHAYRPAPKVDDPQLELDLTKDEQDAAEEFAEEATVWVGGLDRINKVRGIRMMVDLSATPFYLKGTGYQEGRPLPWIVSDFGLVDAIESGITKVPRIPVMDDSGRPDPKYFHLWREIMRTLPDSERETNKRRAKPESVWREAQGALVTLADKWKATLDHFTASTYPVPPALVVVAANTTLARIIADALKAGDIRKELKDENTFQIDSKVLADAEAAEGSTKEDAAQLLRITTATVGKATWPEDKPPEGFEHLTEPPGKNLRCVVSVGMLTEGWDAQNVTQILGLRAFSSQLLCEQVVGRALRRMSYDPDPTTGLLPPEYADIFGVPFEVIPVQGVLPRAAVPPPPSTLVQAVPNRKHLGIDFPRVEGYVMDVRQRIRCDVDAVPELKIEPQIEPTEVVTRTQMGWVPTKAGMNTTTGKAETLTREQFYAEHRLQRTAFEIARDVTEVLAGGKVSIGAQPETTKHDDAARLLFPQVFRVVEDYLDRRLTVTSARAGKEEVALAKYRDTVVSRLLTAIEPDAAAGEAPMLPRIERHRPVGSTADVMFRTVKPTKGTWKSHISHVVLDSIEWEGAAAYHLEQSDRVISYAKNDRLDFEILYEWQGGTHKYIPDFLVRLSMGDGKELTLIIEIKGYEKEQDRAKWTAARKWVNAVNHHGGFGVWDLMICKEPNALRGMVDRYTGPMA